MTDPYKSLDETINAIRAEGEARIKTADEAKFAAEVKATFLEDQLNKAVAARAAAERITMALLTQFSTVEKVFTEAKEMALKVENDQKAATVPPQPEPAPQPDTASTEAHVEGALQP